jgi:hypothetical protein
MIGRRKKEAAICSLNGAVAASIKLVQNYILTQFILQTWQISSIGTVSDCLSADTICASLDFDFFMGIISRLSL